MTAALDAAIGYIGRGWHVFPCWPRTKRPACAHGLRDATLDLATAGAWFSRGYNVAVATGQVSGVVVVDVDVRHGGTVAALERRFGPLPRTPRAVSGGGGLHLWFRAPAFETRANTQVMDGVELKGDRGSITAPPSMHASGRRYAWVREMSPDDLALADLPDAIAQLARRRPPTPVRPVAAVGDTRMSRWAESALEREVEVLASTANGTRNAATNRAAYLMGQLVGARALSEEHVAITLLEAAVSTGLPEFEARAAIRSGLRAGSKVPRGPVERKRGSR